MHQLPSSYLIKVRGNSKFTFSGYTSDTLEALIAAAAEMLLNRQHLDRK